MTQLTRQENFRLGFLLRCAEEGCDAAEIQERVKFAELQKTGGTFADTIRSLLSAGKVLVNTPIKATALGIGGSALLGGAGGYGLAKMQNSDIDPEEAKRQELISAYHVQGDLARRRAQQRSYRRLAPASPRL